MKTRKLFTISILAIAVFILAAMKVLAGMKVNVEDCIKIKNSEWKEGADKVVVKTVDIDFSKIGKEYDFDHMKYYWLLWDTFANKCEEDQFSHITTENWYEKWSYYKGKLMEKANKSGFSGDRLRKCIERIEPKPKNKIALLPVGAYLARKGKDKVWIIICKWEGVGVHEDDIRSLSHIRGWAIKEKNQKEVGSFTCM